jgi:hypothetical protein
MGMGYETKLYVYCDHMKRFDTRKSMPQAVIGSHAETASGEIKTLKNFPT